MLESRTPNWLEQIYIFTYLIWIISKLKLRKKNRDKLKTRKGQKEEAEYFEMKFVIQKKKKKSTRGALWERNIFSVEKKFLISINNIKE